MDPLIVGVVLGSAFVILDLGVLWPAEDEWSGPKQRAYALTASGVGRFVAGFLIGVIDLGLPGWAAGTAIGGVLSLPVTLVDRAPARVLAIGLSAGLALGVVGDVLR